MNLRSIRIGRLAGVPIGFQPLWLVIVALLTWQLGAFYYPDQAPGISPGAAYALGLLSALLLFASILVHELGHAVVSRRHGVEIEEIDLWLLGGVARMRGYPHEAGDELRVALAGPAVTLVVAAVFWLLAAALPSSTPDSIEALIAYQAFINTAILVFNLLPAFPLDGGRVARALLWARTGDVIRATSSAAAIGRGFGYVMIALGLFGAAAGALGGLWFAIIGFFVVVAARAEEAGVKMRAAFAGRAVGRMMSFPAVTIPAQTSVEEAVERFFVRYRYSSFPVLDGETIVGLVGMEAITRLAADRRAGTSVAAIADHDPELIVDEHEDLAALLERPAFQRVGRAIVRRDSGELGITSITDVRRALRALDLRSENGITRHAEGTGGAPHARATHD